jgi:hypothetical protein
MTVLATTTKTPFAGDVLHSDGHSRLSPEEIAKAVARHHREHPNQATNRAVKPQKTSPHR